MNQQLAEENAKLVERKDQYEWNPNLEIKSLEDNLKKQELKIGLI